MKLGTKILIGVGVLLILPPIISLDYQLVTAAWMQWNIHGSEAGVSSSGATADINAQIVALLERGNMGPEGDQCYGSCMNDHVQCIQACSSPTAAHNGAPSIRPKRQ